MRNTRKASLKDARLDLSGPLDVGAELNGEELQPLLPSSISDSDRYSRQILFPGIGLQGQRHLAQAHVAIVGCGATGAASASLLARAGVGTLTVIDRDFVESSNLQRQVLFEESDALQSLPKAEAARRRIALFNSNVNVQSHIADLVPDNVAGLLESADLILDATDNFETRYLINDFSVQQGKPWIYAAAIGAYAATMNILPTPALTGSSADWQPTACLACIFPKPPTGPVETCDTSGILSTAVNLAASLQVTEALKFLTQQPSLMRRSLISFDLWTGDRSEIATSTPDPGCTVCGARSFTHLTGAGRPHITLCGRNSVQIHEHHRPLDLAAMHDRLAVHGNVRSNDLLLRLDLDRAQVPYTITLFADGRAVIQGTTDVALARTLYARYIGS